MRMREHVINFMAAAYWPMCPIRIVVYGDRMTIRQLEQGQLLISGDLIDVEIFLFSRSYDCVLRFVYLCQQ